MSDEKYSLSIADVLAGPLARIASALEGLLPKPKAEKPPAKRLVLPLMTPRLKARLEHYKLEMPEDAPLYDRVFILPMDRHDQPDTTAGGIVLAGQTKDVLGAQRGIIVAAGAGGWEQLYSAGLQIGDYVVTNRLSRWEKQYMVGGRGPYRVLIVTAGEATASRDLYLNLQKGELWYEMDVETGKVYLCDRDGPHDRNDPAPPNDGTV